MDNKTKKLLSECIVLSIFLFAIRYFALVPNSLYDYVSATGEVVSATIFFMCIYCKWIWKYNPFEKYPRLMGDYIVTIDFCYNDKEEKKEMRATIKQTLLSIHIQLITDEITSNTIVGNLVEENDGFVLYYTYMTNPKSRFSKENPIQYGSCRLLANKKDCLEGIYWTSSKTIGDIKFKRIIK